MLCWDDVKRQKTLDQRGLDFADAAEVFAGYNIDQVDGRYEYGEHRILTIGAIDQNIIVIVWTPRDGSRRIISMRKANVREQAQYRDALDRSG